VSLSLSHSLPLSHSHTFIVFGSPEAGRRRRRRYVFGSNSITYKYTKDKIKQTSRARLPENPEVNDAGHPNIQFLVYHETTTTNNST